MLKHRFITRLNSAKEIISPGKKASFSSYVSSSSEDSENEPHQFPQVPEVQIFEKPTPVLVDKPKLEEKNGLTNVNSKWEGLKIQTVQESKNDDKVSEMLNELRQGNNLVKFLESHGLSTSAISVPQLKEAFEQFLSKQSVKKKEISKWEEQLNNLRELTDDKKLEKWLESVGVQPSQVSLPQVKEEIKRYFSTPERLPKTAMPFIDEPVWGKRLGKNSASTTKSELSISLDDESDSDVTPAEVEMVPKLKTRLPTRYGRAEPLENYRGRSLIYQENTLVKKIWDDFKGMSLSKQVAIVFGMAVVTAAVGVFNWRILLMMFPNVLSMNHYWAEVLSQWFIQRQDTAFQLLLLHSENAKPLSTAWANQYILWKYI